MFSHMAPSLIYSHHEHLWLEKNLIGEQIQSFQEKQGQVIDLYQIIHNLFTMR